METVYPAIGLTVLRLTFGALTVAHGFQKWSSMERFMSAWSLSRGTAIAVAVVQTLGGTMIFIGFLTQIAALANSAVNAVILYTLMTKSNEPFLAPGRHSWSIGLAYFAMALALAVGGGGVLVIDNLF